MSKLHTAYVGKHVFQWDQDCSNVHTKPDEIYSQIF